MAAVRKLNRLGGKKSEEEKVKVRERERVSLFSYLWAPFHFYAVNWLISPFKCLNMAAWERRGGEEERQLSLRTA